MTRLLVSLVSIMALAVGTLGLYNQRPLPRMAIERFEGMDFKAAAAFIVPVGEYKGQTIDKAAESDQGLLWLDWMRGARERERQDAGNFFDLQPLKPDPFYAALIVYLNDATIAKDLAEAMRLPKNVGTRGR